MDISKLKVGVTSTAIILGCAGATYYVWKNKRKLRDATDALNYLTINTLTDTSQCDEVVYELRRRSKFHHAIGFDCEWVTDHGKRRPVALLQLSTFDGYCTLFRLDKIKSVPDSLKELLEDKSIYKVGVAPDDDAKYLYQDYAVSLKASLDVRHIAKLCGREPGGLAALSKSLLGVVLDKSWRIRCSDWEADVLSDRQVKYAAADAHVAVRIFARLVDELSVGTVWSLFRRRSSAVWHNLDKLCWQYSDTHFRTKNRPADATVTKDKVAEKKGAVQMSSRYPHATRSKPLYHNCFLQAPDGELLCTAVPPRGDEGPLVARRGAAVRRLPPAQQRRRPDRARAAGRRLRRAARQQGLRRKIRSAARALLYQARRHVLPDQRRRELEGIVLQHYPQHGEITKELLEEAADIQVVSFENAEFECHGQKVAEHFLARPGGLLRLEEMWREHFLAVMRPKYMPHLWSVKHNEERLRVRFKEGRLSEEDLKLIGTCIRL